VHTSTKKKGNETTAKNRAVTNFPFPRSRGREKRGEKERGKQTAFQVLRQKKSAPSSLPVRHAGKKKGLFNLPEEEEGRDRSAERRILVAPPYNRFKGKKRRGRRKGKQPLSSSASDRGERKGGGKGRDARVYTRDLQRRVEEKKGGGDLFHLFREREGGRIQDTRKKK